jgi:hypothetical protein
MAAGKSRRWDWFILGALALVLAAGAAGYRMAVLGLKSRVVRALGPESEIREIRVGIRGVFIEGLRIKGPAMWPAQDALRAERVTIVPSLRSLLTAGPYRILSVTIDDPYLSVLRTKNGKLLAVPSLLAAEGSKGNPGAPAGRPLVIISSISLRNAAVEFFDDTIGPPGRKIRMEGIQATSKDVDVPGFSSKSAFALTGTVKGRSLDGQVGISGWACLANSDSSIRVTLKSMELTQLQPYLSKQGDVKITGGTLDLELSSEVHGKKLRAPGKVTLADLKLAAAKGLWGSFMGMPRGAVLSLLKDRGGRITLDFNLEGDLGNPRFSLNETLSKRLALSMAGTLKVGLGNVAKGAGSMGEKGVEAATGVIKGVGGAVGGLFGGGGRGAGK